MLFKSSALVRLIILKVQTLCSQHDSVFAIRHDTFAVLTGSA